MRVNTCNIFGIVELNLWNLSQLIRENNGKEKIAINIFREEIESLITSLLAM